MQLVYIITYIGYAFTHIILAISKHILRKNKQYKPQGRTQLTHVTAPLMLLLTQSEEAYGLNAYSLFLFFIRVLDLVNVCSQND